MADVIGNTIPTPIMLYGRAPNGQLQAVTTDGSGNISVTGSASSVAFSGITSGTNTTATMVVGTGASFASTPQLNIGAVGTSGVLGLLGTTSGTATFTAPAVAGTATNPISISNSLQLPSGTVYNFNADTGISRASANNVAFGNGTAGDITAHLQAVGAKFGGNIGINYNTALQIVMSSDYSLAWNTAVGGIGGVVDTGLSRASAGVIDVGNGTVGDASGTLNAAGYQAGGTAGVSVGPLTSVTSITTKAGIVTVLAGASDERLKDAEPYKGGLAEVEAINPVSYRWNEKGQEHTGLSGDKEYVGFIAQDIQKAIPQAITATEKSKDGNEEYLSFDDRPIIAALVNAVKELTARIKILETQKIV